MLKRVPTILFVVLLAGLPRPTFAQATDAAGPLFNDQVLHEVRLSVNTKDLQVLHDHWADNTHVPADFKVDGQVVHDVSLKSHGGGSRRPNKLSLKVGFDHYTTGQTFLGLHSVLLRNNSQDPTGMRERLSMLFFRNLGAIAPREAHARLYINNQYAGLYTLVEEFDEDFLQKNVHESTGNLYEFHPDNVALLAGQPAFNFRYLGPDPSLYVPLPLDPKTLPNNPRGDLIARFTQATGDTGAAGWRDNVSAFLDLPKFIRNLAIENFVAEEDGLTGDYGPNNYYLYRFATSTMFVFLPWDKSNTFWNAPSPDYPIFHNIVDGREDYKNQIVVRAFQEPDLLQLYLDTMLECAAFAMQGADVGQPGWLEAEVNREYAQIHAAALDDTILYTNDQFEQGSADLLTFVQNRAASIVAQVAAVRGPQ